MLGRDDLVLCSGTLGVVGLREKVDAARAGGFSGISLWSEDVLRAEGLSLHDVGALLLDAGLAVAELDPLLRWLPGEEVPANAPGASEEEFYRIADAVGARSLNLAQAFGSHLDVDRAAEAMAGVCDRAVEHDLLVTLEYLPWSGIPDAATALAVVENSGRRNATLMVDTWHTFRGSSGEAQLRALPGARVGGVQINDAPAAAAADLVVETMTARLLPGEGDVPLVDWIRVLDAIGSDAPVGVEVFSTDLARLPPREIGRRCGEAGRAVLAAARER